MSQLSIPTIANIAVAAVLFSTAIPSRVLSAEPIIVRLWPSTPPGPMSKVTGPEQDFTKPDDRLIADRPIIKLGNVSQPEIHVYRPPAERANGTTVVVCPGGGFSILAWDLEGLEVAEWLNSIGVVAAVLKYRVPTREHAWPGMVEGPAMDAQRAVSIVRSRSQEWGVDSNRIGILGFSAGGATAARVVARSGTRAYEPIDAADESVCLVNFALLIYPGAIVDEKGELRADYQVATQAPPMFFVHAANDEVKCENSVKLFLALRNAEVPFELHVFSSGGHGYGLRPTDEPVTRWPALAENWISKLGK